MFNTLKSVFLSIALLLLFVGPVYPFSGPLRYSNQFPLFLHTNAPMFESAKTEGGGFSAQLSYSSIHQLRNSKDWSIALDMEIATFNLAYKIMVKDFFELTASLPVHSFHNGFMDDFVNSYHDAFDFPDYGRRQRPINDFLYEVKRNGKTVIKGRNGRIDVGDLRLSFKREILCNDPVFSIKADVEFPTGDGKRGFGNESIDGAVSLLVDKNLGRLFKLYGNFGVVFPGNLNAYEKIDLKTYLFFNSAVEFQLSKNFTLPLNLHFQTSPYYKTGIRQVDDASVQLALGFRYLFKKYSTEFSIVEDLNTTGAPDFVLNFVFF